jgi:pimeloyl-ACP methyl ester carboxylesterase
MRLTLLSLSLTLACGLWAQDPFQVKVTGHGRPVILIPGLSSSGETWDTTVARYQDRFQCHVLTLAGFAGVPRIPAPMLEHVREGIAVYIRKNKLDHPVIVGHSLGGFLALDLAAHDPELPGRLVIVDSYPFLGGVVDPKATIEQAREMAGQMRGYIVSVTGADSAWAVFYVAATGPRRYREKEVSLQLVVREAELRALEAQLNPHFLFNSLNSIRALVAENPPLAQDMLTRLANILRYNLHRDLMPTIPLASELEAVTDYLALEGVRFEDRLHVEFAIDPAAAEMAVPPMLLQTLVENALKHGIAPLPSGGEILIRAALQDGGMLLEVENTGQIAAPKPGATQVGLANTRERLRILYGDGGRLDLANRDGNRVIATMRIPRPA